MSTQTAATPEAVTEACVATWNETDPLRRRAGIDAMLAGVRGKFPSFVLKCTSKVDAHNGALRFTWSLGPVAGPSVVEGVDFCALAPDGRLASVVGFIDKMPGSDASTLLAPFFFHPLKFNTCRFSRF